MTLPFSAACERNKQPILDVLAHELGDARSLLEVGSGTGQHAEFFAAHLSHLAWQPTELAENLRALHMRLALSTVPNLLPARALDVEDHEWVMQPVDAVFTANTVHIMSWPHVQMFFAGVGRSLTAAGIVLVYGPFRYQERHTSASNAAFDIMLRAGDVGSGVRDFEALDSLARGIDLHLHADHALPANNHLLIWRKAPK